MNPTPIIKKRKFRLARFLIVKKVHLLALTTAAKYGVLSDVWYVFSGQFRREHKAALNGRLKHKNSLKAKNSSGAVYTLRRNTHRLEKGLIMKPRRPVFALDFIEQTVSVYKAIIGNDIERPENEKTLMWARDVLQEYFACVDLGNEVIAKAKESFSSCQGLASGETELRPYVRDLDERVGVSIDDLHQLAIRRRSCRWFRSDPVPRKLIDRAVEIGTLAPSACNRQPYEFRIFDHPELAQQIGAIPGGTAGFNHNFPCVIVLVGDLAAFPYDRDRHVPYIDASLAAMGFQFALEAQGLSSCCINWPEVESREKALCQALGLNGSQRVIMLIAVGYPDPDAMVPYSQKKTLNEIRSYNQTC
jgi:nitroreductase